MMTQQLNLMIKILLFFQVIKLCIERKNLKGSDMKKERVNSKSRPLPNLSEAGCSSVDLLSP